MKRGRGEDAASEEDEDGDTGDRSREEEDPGSQEALRSENSEAAAVTALEDRGRVVGGGGAMPPRKSAVEVVGVDEVAVVVRVGRVPNSREE